MQSMESFDKRPCDMASLLTTWEESLEEFKSSFSEPRYRWMKGLANNVYVTKIAVINGYLMGVRDCGVNIGPLLGLTQMMLSLLDN